jgi:hypothetical protein
MPRIRCSGCDRLLQIPEDSERTVFRCKGCKELVYLEDEEDDRAERRPARRAAVKAASPLRKKVRLAPAKTDWLVMLAVILPLTVVLLFLSLFFPLVAGALFFLGIALLIVGVKRMQTAIRTKGLQDFYAEAPWYARGGFLLLYTEIYHTWNRPKLLGLWMFMEWFGALVLVLACTIMGAAEASSHPGR